MIREFAVIQTFDGVEYLAEIYAKDWEHAERIAQAMGGELDGEITGRWADDDDDMWDRSERGH